MAKVYMPLLGSRTLPCSCVQPNCNVWASVSQGHIVLNAEGRQTDFRLPPGYAVCLVTESGESLPDLYKASVLNALVDLRKRVTQASGNWGEENMAMLWDVAKTLGFDDIDMAYISGDIDELYRKAR